MVGPLDGMGWVEGDWRKTASARAKVMKKNGARGQVLLWEMKPHVRLSLHYVLLFFLVIYEKGTHTL